VATISATRGLRVGVLTSPVPAPERSPHAAAAGASAA
jgi:hypothetical protein